VLIVEDEPKLAAVLRDYFNASAFQTDWMEDGRDVVEAVRTDPPSLILLDLMLPHHDGLCVCRELRTFSKVPVVMLTARVEEVDRLLGFDLGADDYICKPFSPREVVARAKAVLRRVSAPVAAPRGVGLSIDEIRYKAFLDGVDLDLTAVEFRLLKALTASPDRVFTRAQLLDQLYEDARAVTDRAVDSHVKNLRRKLTGIRADSEPIQSVYGVGYRLNL
jgi:two-component system response regulator BaeR